MKLILPYCEIDFAVCQIDFAVYCEIDFALAKLILRLRNGFCRGEIDFAVMKLILPWQN